MKVDESFGKRMAVYAAVLGALYVIVGSVEFATAFWNWFIVPGGNLSLLGLPCDDLFGGFAALVIGAVFFGAIPLWKARYEAIGFVLVGSLLSATYGAVYLLIVGADGLGTLLAYLSGEGWTWEWLTAGTLGTGLLRPEIWLAFLSAPLGYVALKTVRRGEKRGE